MINYVFHCGECGAEMATALDVEPEAVSVAELVRLLHEKFGDDASTVCPRCQTVLFLEMAGISLTPSERLLRARIAQQLAKQGAVRFGVGSASGPRSGVWRVWTNNRRDDVYIAARTLGSELKVSLHPGFWYFGFTERHAGRESNLIPPGRDRRLHRWERPAEFTPGWTRAFEIVVPESELVDHGKAYEGAQAIWLPAPASGQSVHFNLLLSKPGAPRGRRGFPTAEGYESVSEIVTRLGLSTGEDVWVIAHVQPTDPTDSEKIQDVRTRMGAAAGDELRRRADGNPAFAPRAVVFGDRTPDVPAFLDVSLHDVLSRA